MTIFERLRRQFIARQTVNGVIAPHDRELAELAAALQARLLGIRAEMDDYVAEKDTHQAPTVRGTTAHPLLSYEREITSELRQLNTELKRRVDTHRRIVPETPTAEELPQLARLRVAK